LLIRLKRKPAAAVYKVNPATRTIKLTIA